VVAEMGRRSGGAGFALAAAALGSGVRRLDCSVYDLDPADVGQFDFVYVGSLLLHLRDPVGALARVRAVCRGELVVVDAIDVAMTRVLRRRPVASLDGRGRPWWWKPNLAGLVRMVEAAGFAAVGRPGRVRMPPGAGQRRDRVTARQLLSRAGREAVSARRGDPHGVVRARPA
jgi:hypothetical protein